MPPPSTQLAILFADISGSTKLYDTLGDQDAMATIERCLSELKRVSLEFGGRVVKTIGDEVMAVFPYADNAARAASEMQARVSHPRARGAIPLAIRIGLQFGPVIEEDGDVYGDSVNVAARMTGLAKAGQIITGVQTLNALSPPLRARTREVDILTVQGKQKDISIFEFIWQESEDELTALSVRHVLAPAKLRVRHGERDIELNESSPVLTVGRDLSNDVVIADRKASRMHGRVERRRDKFVLVDHSSNGMYVTVEGYDEVALRREEMTLRGRGRISFGHGYADDPTEYVAFEVLG